MANFSLDKFNLEHTECDFKREVEHKKTKSWLKSVSAFANGIGGALICSEIHIDIFDDRLVIQNPGGMYDGIPVQNQELENVVSTRRNPVIADLLTRMDFMERRGSGFRKILDAVKFAPNYTEENLPVFNSNPYSFNVTFKNMNYGVEPIETENSQNTVEKSGMKDGVSSQKTCLNVGVNEQKLLNLIAGDSAVTAITASEVLSISKRQIERLFSSLKNKGLIRRVGAAKGGHWEVVSGAENK